LKDKSIYFFNISNKKLIFYLFLFYSLAASLIISFILVLNINTLPDSDSAFLSLRKRVTFLFGHAGNKWITGSSPGPGGEL